MAIVRRLWFLSVRRSRIKITSGLVVAREHKMYQAGVPSFDAAWWTSNRGRTGEYAPLLVQIHQGTVADTDTENVPK